MSTPGERLKQARLAKGYETTVAAAEALGMPQATYAQHENGLRGFPAKRAPQYARAFATTTDWLLFGRGEPPKGFVQSEAYDRVRRTVPLVGYVGASAEAHFYGAGDGGLGEVDAPEKATEKTVAVEIRGTSLGPIFENWLIYYDDVRSPVTEDLVGHLCVVGLPDKRVLVKRLKPSRHPGIFHLESNTEGTMTDELVEWAARVTDMKPR